MPATAIRALHLLTLAVLVYLGAVAVRIVLRRYYIWLPAYFTWVQDPPPQPPGPKNIFFFFTDHFEPGADSARMQRWEQEFPRLADQHRDSAGRPLQHTWFYPGEQLVDENLQGLRRLVQQGYGEVELHLHHAYDTLGSVRLKYQTAIAGLQRYGFLQTIDGRTRFGFIHGNGGLNNRRGPEYCGVDHEVELLRQAGAYAFFDYPNLWQDGQPALVNSIHYAQQPDLTGPLLTNTARSGPEPGAALILQGPLVLRPTWRLRQLFLAVEDGYVQSTQPLTQERVDSWIRANVHVRGRPDWIFIKLSAHGAGTEQDTDDILRGSYHQALSYLESNYNDGHRYRLHYVTAREAYNLARAAAANQFGPPEQYYDWVIPPYVANQPAAPPGLRLTRRTNGEGDVAEADRCLPVAGASGTAGKTPRGEASRCRM